MEQLFNIDLDKITSFSKKENIERKKTLSYFLRAVFLIKKMKVGNLQI